VCSSFGGLLWSNLSGSEEPLLLSGCCACMRACVCVGGGGGGLVGRGGLKDFLSPTLHPVGVLIFCFAMHCLSLLLYVLQEYQRLEKQSRQRPAGWRDDWGGYGYGDGGGYGYRDGGGYGARRPPPRKPLFKLLQEALLSERDLQMIKSERLQYTQLLYRWGGMGGGWKRALGPAL
jgi:hypothetical protein